MRVGDSGEHAFFRVMALLLTLTVVVGFGPTYYWRFLTGARAVTTAGGPFTWVIHLHAAIFTAWLVVFNVQSFLVSSGRVTLHRRLGVAGACLAAAMVVTGAMAAIDTAAQGLAPRPLTPAAFAATPLFSIALFAAFVSTAILRRRDRQQHKRLMLLAFIVLTGPAVARILLGLRALGPAGAIAGPFVPALLALVAMAFDRDLHRSVRPVYVWGALTIVGASLVRMTIAPTAAWRGFVEGLISLSG